ncbi:MAG: cytochrome c oxidase subunit 3 family protein [Ignavibacteriales bacterium]|jgi:cytochrome c oxidase subunit III|nr:cytochrome c oxidase subunit 3 family protein [Ignavibacteriales bacterium]
MATENAIAHHDEHRDDEGSRIGMWLFLVTELLLFGGMFFVFAVYKYVHYDAFHLASKELSALVGTINTIVLLTSSLTIALSIKAMEDGRKTLSLVLQSTTLVFALVFLVNKYFEWSAKISHGTYPGSEEMMSRPNGEILFFGLYYVMTGLHALHVIVGLIIIAVMILFTVRGSIDRDRHVHLVNAGLYWHLVDVIWIFLFPLFYLIA